MDARGEGELISESVSKTREDGCGVEDEYDEGEWLRG